MSAVHNGVMDVLTNFVLPNDLHVHWSLMIVLYPYITGIIAGAFIVSSLYHVFKIESLKPVSRYSLIFALAFLACATWPLLNHLGHPERALNMMLTPSPSSAMAGFGYIYSAYAILLIFEILLIYRPVMVALKARSTGLLHIIYGILTFGSDNVSSQSLKLDHKIIGFLAGLGIPMACVLHGYVGFIFGGIKANPTWSTPLMPVIFLLSASVSGISGVIFTYVTIQKFRKKPVDAECVRTLTKFLWGVFILCFTFEMLEIFTHSYLKTHHWEMIHGLLWGPLYKTFWVSQVGIFSLIPMLLLAWMCLFRVGNATLVFWSTIASGMLLVQVLLMRWNVVIGGQLMSKSGRGFTTFHPQFLEKEGILPAIIIMVAPLVILYLLEKIFPMWMDDERLTALDT
ncbi:MAG TPA: polysulfide reductase [Thermodesulfobacteriaceae bacterium]|nr:polysulfide reductase [Thermodesulfobacteriaceae bacterium]